MEMVGFAMAFKMDLAENQHSPFFIFNSHNVTYQLRLDAIAGLFIAGILAVTTIVHSQSPFGPEVPSYGYPFVVTQVIEIDFSPTRAHSCVYYLMKDTI